MEDQLAMLEDEEECGHAWDAYQHLMHDPESSYGRFVSMHHKFLRRNRAEIQVDERRLQLPRRALEEEGLECAVWPHLYPKTAWCETHVRQQDVRRKESRQGRARRRRRTQPAPAAARAASSSSSSSTSSDPDSSKVKAVLRRRHLLQLHAHKQTKQEQKWQKRRQRQTVRTKKKRQLLCILQEKAAIPPKVLTWPKFLDRPSGMDLRMNFYFPVRL